jgi:Flp pilus assembly protein TadD
VFNSAKSSNFARAYLSKNPKDRDATLVLALALIRQEKYAEASKALQELPKDNVEHFPAAGFLMAWAVMQEGDKVAAEKHFQEASKLLESKVTPDRLPEAAVPEWHHRLEARLLQNEVRTRLNSDRR